MVNIYRIKVEGYNFDTTFIYNIPSIIVFPEIVSRVIWHK